MFDTIRQAQEFLQFQSLREVANVQSLGDAFGADASGGDSDFTLTDYQTAYINARDAYLEAAEALKLASGPYKASRDAYVAAASTYTKSLYS
mmetsp:Transcript_43610/g.89160  ORF Transcript_43610/g.89160 Transcript_43610/m.89160 type:complete len:92 (+) Transcript_43610:21-296(+)